MDCHTHKLLLDHIAMTHSGSPPLFVTLGMFIIDEFLFMDGGGNASEKTVSPQGSSWY